MTTGTNKRNGVMNGISQKWILVAIGVVAGIGVMGSVFSPNNIVQILGFCSLITVSLLAHLQSMRTAQQTQEQNAEQLDEVKAQATIAATKVEKVASVLESATKRSDAQTAQIVEVVKETKTLVNSGSLIQLKINQRSAIRLAELLPNDPEVIKDRDAANKMVEDHEKAQVVASADKAQAVAAIELEQKKSDNEGESLRVTVVNPNAIQVEDKTK